MRTVCINFEKFVKQRTVVDHCLTHFFRSGFIALPPQRQCAGGAIILHNDRMIDRQIVRTPIEIFEGVAPRGHHLRDELVGVADGALRVIDKARLNATPLAGECIGVILRQLAQVETTDPISAFPENGFSTCLADRLNGSFILRAKTFA